MRLPLSIAYVVSLACVIAGAAIAFRGFKENLKEAAKPSTYDDASHLRVLIFATNIKGGRQATWLAIFGGVLNVASSVWALYL